jgi:hypothetical protein
VFIELEACTPELRQRISEIHLHSGDHSGRTGARSDGSQPARFERRTGRSPAMKQSSQVPGKARGFCFSPAVLRVSPPLFAHNLTLWYDIARENTDRVSF